MIDLKTLFTRYSTWVVAALAAAAAYWLQLSPEEQTELLAAYPVLKHFVPAAGFVAFLVARGIPQTPKEPPQ